MHITSEYKLSGTKKIYGVVESCGVFGIVFPNSISKSFTILASNMTETFDDDHNYWMYELPTEITDNYNSFNPIRLSFESIIEEERRIIESEINKQYELQYKLRSIESNHSAFTGAGTYEK